MIEELFDYVDDYIESKLKEKKKYFSEANTNKPEGFSYEDEEDKSRQHINIKNGFFNESFHKYLISTYTDLEILDSNIIAEEEKRKLDILILDKEKKIIYNVECKNSLKLDNGKVRDSVIRINDITTKLNDLYPDYSVVSYLVSNLQLDRQLYILKKTKVVPNFKVIGFDHFLDVLCIPISDLDYICICQYYKDRLREFRMKNVSTDIYKDSIETIKIKREV